VVLSAAVLSLSCFFLGITASYMLDTPGGASVVLVNLAALLIASAVSALRSRRKK